MVKQVKLGDVFAINTSKGIAIAQVTHRNKQYGYLIRIFPNFLSDVKHFTESHISQDATFTTFFPVPSAIKLDMLNLIGNFHITEKNKAFPIFKCPMPNLNLKTKNISWIWDGERSIKRNRAFSKKELTYPRREIISFPLLVERIESEFTDK